MINSVILIGNLGKDPELKTTEGGLKVVQFSVATNESYKDKSGEWQNHTEWHNIVAWSQLAERIAEKLKKGDRVYLEGKLRTDKYEKDGQTHYTTKIVASGVRSLERSEKPKEVDTGMNGYGDKEDDLPF